MLQYAVTGKPSAPMPSRISAWGIYDVFEVKNQEKIFLAIVSDQQWQSFCAAFDLADLQHNPAFASNNLRVTHRNTLLPLVSQQLAHHNAAEIAAIFERHQLPYAPITQPEQLFDDPHLLATGGLDDIEIAVSPLNDSTEKKPKKTRKTSKTPLLPLSINGQRLRVRKNPPQLGEHSHQLLLWLGYSDTEINHFIHQKIVATT